MHVQNMTLDEILRLAEPVTDLEKKLLQMLDEEIQARDAEIRDLCGLLDDYGISHEFI